MLKLNKLTNQEITARVRECSKIVDPCDRAIALKRFEKEYKRTAFFKETHIPLNILYYQIQINDWTNKDILLARVNDFIHNIDASHILEVMDQINTDTKSVIDHGQDIMSASGFADMIKNLNK